MSDDGLLGWSPVLIGFTFSGFMYGITLGQAFCYSYWFPNDFMYIKTLVFGIFVADTAFLIGSTQLFWTLFISCHRSNSSICEPSIPWGAFVMTICSVSTTFVVQCFYCHRIWTISGNNKPLTLAICSSAMVELVFGTWYNIEFARIATLKYMSQSPLILPFAGASTLCDILITTSIFKYMWKSGFRRQRTIIQDMAFISINMGTFTCLISLVIGVVFLVQGDSFWVVSIGVVMGRSYVNSMLAVLNARKRLREREMNVYELSII